MIKELRELAKQWRENGAELARGLPSAPWPPIEGSDAFEQAARELESVLPRQESYVTTIVAVFFSLNGHAAQVAFEHIIRVDEAARPGSSRNVYNVLFPPPGKWDRYGEAPYWSMGFDGAEPDPDERGHIDVVGFLKAAGQISALVMNRPERGAEVEPWDGCKARAEHWTWAAGVWKGAAMALGCEKIKTVKDAESVEDLLKVGRQMVGYE